MIKQQLLFTHSLINLFIKLYIIEENIMKWIICTFYFYCLTGIVNAFTEMDETPHLLSRFIPHIYLFIFLYF